MDSTKENLYETRTNLFNSENIIDYLYKRCEKSTYPFKPDNSFSIQCKEIDSQYYSGKEIMKQYVLPSKDQKNADIKGSQDYNFEIDTFQTLSSENIPVSSGKLALVYKTDRKYYCLFELLENEDGQEELHLIMKVKQKVGLFGSFETQMVYYY